MKVSVVQAVLALLLVGSCSADSLAARSFDVTRHFGLSANSTCGGDPPTLFEDQNAPGVPLNCTAGEYEVRLALDGDSNTRWQSATGDTPVTLTFSLQQVGHTKKGEGLTVGGTVSLASQTQPTPARIAFSITHGEGRVRVKVSTSDQRKLFVCLLFCMINEFLQASLAIELVAVHLQVSTALPELLLLEVQTRDGGGFTPAQVYTADPVSSCPEYTAQGIPCSAYGNITTVIVCPVNFSGVK